MNFIKPLQTLGRYAIDLVFPVCCIVCGEEGAFLCNRCENNLPRITVHKCIVCRKPSPFGKTHPDCGSKNTVDGLISALPYQDPEIENLIEIYKYKFVKELKNQLSSLLVSEIQKQSLENYFADFTLIPVPLHRRRFEWRGFNQALLLSKELSALLRNPLNETLVVRVKNTKPQTRLNREERRTNIENAFAVNDDSAQGRKFLLIDDVVTSGATVNEIAKLLKKQGALEIWAASVAHG